MNIFKRLLRRFAYLLTLLAGFILVILAAFYWWFPSLAQHKKTIEEFLSAEVNQPVVIQQLDTRWRGMRLLFQARGVRVRGVDDTQSAMRLGELRMAVNPLPLLLGKIRLHSLVVHGFTVELVRALDGGIKVAKLAATGPRPQQGLGALEWWFRQQNVRIEHANIVWRDQREPERTLHFTDIELSMQRHDEVRDFTGAVQLPPGLGKRVSITGKLNGLPVGDDDWGGVIEFTFADLNVAELPRALAELLPWRTSGHLGAHLSTSFVNGRPVGGVGEINVADFVIPYKRDQAPLAAKRLHTEVSWHRDGSGWRVLLLHPELDIGRVLAVDQMEIDWMGDVYTFRLENMDLNNTVSAVKESKIKLPWQYVLDRVKPAGRINSAKVTVSGKLSAPEEWRFEGDFSDLGWAPYQHFPGLSGVHGTLQLNAREGQLRVRDGDIELDFPQVLRAPVRFPQLRGDITWNRDKENWSVHVTQLALANQDIEISEGTVSARLPVEPGPSPYIDAKARVDRLQLASIKHYLPAKVMKPKGLEWADHAFAGGHATDGSFTLRGHVKDFPYADDRGGEFRFTAKVHNGVLVYDPKWPAVKDIDADVIFDNEWLRVNARRGRIMNSVLTGATAVSDELFLKKKPKVLRVDGKLRAKVADAVQFLTRGPLIKNQRQEIPEMSGDGEGLLSLNLDLPLGRLKESSQVAGVYTFKDASVAFTKNGIGMTQLQGQLSFTERTVSGQGLQARMLDGPVSFDVNSVKPQKPPNFVIDFKGKGNVKGLAPILSDSLVGFLHGEQVPWRGRLQVDRGRAVLNVRSTATGLRADLPAPLNKRAAERWDISTRAVFERGSRNIKFNIADRLQGVLLMHKDGDDARFDRGRITYNKGEPVLPQDPGVQVAVATADFDADAWLKAWKRGREFAQARGPDKDDTGLLEALRLLRLDTRAIRFLGRELGAMQIEAHSGDSLDWVARLAGTAAAGAARVRFNREDKVPPQFKLVLERLYWPKGLENNDPSTTAEHDLPQDYPRLAIDVDDFRYADWRMGRMRLRAEPANEGWRIDNITTEHPALKVTGTGLWHSNIPGQQTVLQFEVRSDDSGKALTQLGYPNQVAGGKAVLRADLRWPGSPGQFRFARLDGEVDLEAKKGRFLQVNPGGGRLMGLFNVDALARRITFDFTDVFSKGLAFDRINAKSRVSQGNLFSDGIFIVGPAAMIEAQGRVGLDQEDYDMELIIAPDVGGNLTLLSALANPAAGAVVFLVQKVFKKQLAKVVHYRYQVNGPWDNPHVVRLRQQPEPDTTDEPAEIPQTN